MSGKFKQQWADPKSILISDLNQNGLLAAGTGAPSNSVAGYAIGCIYIRTDGAAQTCMYRNEGTASSSTWVAVPTSGATLAALTVTALTATTATITTDTVTTLNVTKENAGVGASTAGAGTNSGNAGALPAGTAKIYPTTGADDTVGVRMHASDNVTGRIILVGNGVSNKILKVYPPTGGTINGAAADAGFSTASGKGAIVACYDSTANTATGAFFAW